MTIIKNFSMPHNCYDCDLHNYHECDLTTESIEEDYCWNGDSREKHCPLREVEAIPKDQYEAKLKADMVDMLKDLRLEIEKIFDNRPLPCSHYQRTLFYGEVDDLILDKINALKEASDA